MSATVQNVLGQSQEPRIEPRSVTWLVGTHLVEPSPGFTLAGRWVRRTQTCLRHYDIKVMFKTLCEMPVSSPLTIYNVLYNFHYVFHSCMSTYRIFFCLKINHATPIILDLIISHDTILCDFFSPKTLQSYQFLLSVALCSRL